MASSSRDGQSYATDDPVAPVVPDRVVPRPRRILPALTFCFMAGLFVAATVQMLIIPVVVVTVIFLLLSIIFHQSVLASASSLIAVAGLGVLWMTASNDAFRPDHIAKAIRHERESITFQGRIIDMPQSVTFDSSGRTNWSFICRVERVGTEKNQQPASGNVRVLVAAEPGIDPAYGDRWLWSGIIRIDDRPLIQSLGIAGTVYANPARSHLLATNQGNKFVSWCYGMREIAYDRLGWGLPEDSASVAMARALLLGYRQDVSRPVYDAFSRTGTLHILALSGMHVGILVLLLVIVLKALGVSRQYWVLYFAPFLIAYTVATGAAASMVRATIMALVYFSALLLKRKPDAMSSLSVAALLILLVSPIQLFSLGFILSFVAVGGLVTVYPRMMEGFRQHDQEAWAEPEQHWFQLSSPIKIMIAGMVCVSVSAWVVTLPLIVAVSHLISPVALVVNLPMGPLSFVMLLTGCLSLVTSMISEQLAITFNHANDVFTGWLLALIESTSHWPAAYFYVVSWPLAVMLAWYVLLILAVVRDGWWRRISLGVMLLMVVVSIGQRGWSDKVEAVLIPCGDSDVLLIDGPGDHAVLLDAGSVYQNRNLIDTLRSRGISRIDQLWISRATTDAYGGVDGLLDGMNVETIIAPEPPSRQSNYHHQFAHWKSRLPPERVRMWSEMEEPIISKGVDYQMMHPGGNHDYTDARRSSLILRVSHGHASVLFAGRLDHIVEDSLLKGTTDWNAQRLVIGSCLDPKAFSSSWLGLVNPQHLHINLRQFDRQPSGPGPVLARLAGHHQITVEPEAETPVDWSLSFGALE